MLGRGRPITLQFLLLIIPHLLAQSLEAEAFAHSTGINVYTFVVHNGKLQLADWQEPKPGNGKELLLLLEREHYQVLKV